VVALSFSCSSFSVGSVRSVRMTSYDRRHDAWRRIIRSLNRSHCSVTLKVYWLNLFAKFSVTEHTAVSLTSVCCKTLDILIRDHVMRYLLDNSLLSEKQCGFIKGRCVSLQLLQMMDKWTDYLEDGGQELHRYRPQTISATLKTISATGKVHIGHM